MYHSNSCKAVEANILYVGGPGNYTQIQEAIDASNSGDFIYVNTGIYFENIFINKSITLIGNNKPIIDGLDKLYSVFMKCNYSTISSFIFQNGEIAIYIGGGFNLSHNILINNTFTNNTNGIYLQDSSNNNQIIGNTFEDNDEAIHLQNSSYNNFFNNSIKKHNSYAFILWDTSNFNNISNNYISDNKGIGVKRWSNNNKILSNQINNGGITLFYSFNNLISSNVLSNCDKSIKLEKSHDNTIIENHIENNNIGINLKDSDDNTIDSNTFSNNNQDFNEEAKLPKVKTPGFELVIIIISSLIILIYRKNRK